jgi:signal transduction histidine kinase/CheY-like chemotaxis protein
MATSKELSEMFRRHSELEASLQEMQQGNIFIILIVLIIAGVLLVGGSAQLQMRFDGALVGICLYLIVGIVWVTRSIKSLPGWFLGLGLTGIILALVFLAKITPLICLLAFPIGIVALLVSGGAGTFLALLCTLVILFPFRTLVHDTPLAATALIGAWSMVLLIWLTKRPLITALEWFWASYDQSHALLEKARDYQVELNQTLEDLASANTQLNRLNRLAQGLRQAAEDARHEKEQFVARVSHELRTPLNMIIGYSEMILKSPGAYGRKLPPALLADLSVIYRNSQHLSAMIDDVLDLSQIASGQMALSKEHVSLTEILQSAALAVQPLFNSKGLYLKIEIPEEASIYCDRTRIREVAINLLSNAGRFTEQGGVTLMAQKHGEDFLVKVSDTGPGILPGNQERIFVPFEQADHSIQRRYGGTGLGLAISRSFVELHGGKMWVESEVGQGATFYFTLPVEPPVVLKGDFGRWINPHFHYEERTHRPSLPALQIKPRLVVVDPGGTMPHLLSRYMDEAEVVPVQSLAAATQLIAQTPAQAILVNSRLTEETLEDVRKAGTAYGTPVLVCSMPGPADAATSLGVSHYLMKPISREVILHTLQQYSLPSKTVLIVDDEPEALQLFRRMILSEDPAIRVITAANGKQALLILLKEPIDLILLDLVMPEMDGIELLKAMSQDAKLKSTPVVVISASDQPQHFLLTEELAIARPGGFTTSQILETIRAVSQILGTPGQSGDAAMPAVLPVQPVS